MWHIGCNGSRRSASPSVMLGLEPTIHTAPIDTSGMDARLKADHDGVRDLHSRLTRRHRFGDRRAALAAWLA
ncbi:hypothetical protein EFR00_17655 [Rhizobium sophoriradicis]|nr:hypothetical protein EFR00_17655 [Rhizobium sophoriradicis]